MIDNKKCCFTFMRFNFIFSFLLIIIKFTYTILLNKRNKKIPKNKLEEMIYLTYYIFQFNILNA